MERPDEQPRALSRVLEKDEQVIWSGRPSAGAYVFGGLVVTVPLGLIAIGSTLSWTNGMELGGLPVWAKIVVGVVLLFAAHMLLLRPLLGFHLARRTYYAITDKRALVVCEAWGCRIQQLHHDRGELLVVEGPKDFGKIQFGRTASSSIDVLLLGRAAIPGFYGLRSLGQVHETLRNQRSEVERQERHA